MATLNDDSNTIPTEENYRITLDKNLIDNIRTIIELELKARDLDQESNAWYQVTNEIQERLTEVAWLIVFDFKELPF